MSIESILGRISEIEGRITQIKQKISNISPEKDFSGSLRAAEKKLKEGMKPAAKDVGKQRNAPNALADLPVKMPRITYDSIKKNAAVEAEPRSRVATASGAQAASQLPPQIAGLRTRSGAEIGSIILQNSRKHDIDPLLVSAIMAVESDYDHKAVSNKGAMGLMQLMPGTASDLGVENPFDVGQNIEGGTRYMRMMLDRFAGDTKLALAAYNAGPNAVARSGGIPDNGETENYVMKVLENYEKMLKGASKAPSGDAAARARVEVMKNSGTMSDALFSIQKEDEEGVEIE